MTPSSSIPNVSNEAHAHTKFLCKRLAAAVSPWGGKNFFNLHLCQFGIVTLLAARQAITMFSGIMIISTKDFLGVLVGPMIAPTRKSLKLPSWARPAPSAAMPLPVLTILLRCGPIQVRRNIVPFIAIHMRAMMLRRRPWSLKCLANKGVRRAIYRSAVDPQGIPSISPVVSRGQSVVEVFALPIRDRSTDNTCAGHLIVGCFLDRAPFDFRHATTFAYNTRKSKEIQGVAA